MNKRLLAKTSIDAMSTFDWIAHFLCSYVVGLQVCGEIKDTALCEMAMEGHLKELSLFWRGALNFLNRLRSQVFLQPLMGKTRLSCLRKAGRPSPSASIPSPSCSLRR